MTARPGEHANELALLIGVDLADDRVVPDVLFDGEFEIDAHATFSTTRNLALRARGLPATSSSPGCTGRRVTAVTTPASDKPADRLLHDAVLERMKRDDRQPSAGRQQLPRPSSTNASRPSSSPFTQIRSA